MFTSNWFGTQGDNRVTRAGAILALLLALGPGRASAAEMKFYDPTTGDNHRVDICYEWGMQCAGEAASMWCVSRGFDRALEWEVDQDIGATHPTIVIGTGQICAEAHCDGYASITCVREDAWTQSSGTGGLLVRVGRTSWQSTEGVLVVAVSEQDPTHAVSGVIDLNGLALLHTPPGDWLLFTLNFKNPQQILPHPSFPIEVPSDKRGIYYEITLD